MAAVTGAGDDDASVGAWRQYQPAEGSEGHSVSGEQWQSAGMLMNCGERGGGGIERWRAHREMRSWKGVHVF